MILILKNKFFVGFNAIIFSVVFLFAPEITLAQQSLSLSVTPTLFEMSANPGQLWKSSVKVVNSNKFDLTVYVHAVNFEPQGETGQGNLLPVFEKKTKRATLAEWIDIDSEPVVVPRERSMEIPFIVSVPDDASPGGHFAAILISTQPPEPNNKLSVRTAQIVTSLFFVRISGDIIESGDIRSFTTEKSFVQKSESTFILRFENKGNVYLQPRGDIKIFNMWGKERGIIPINENTHFGNVLPASIRKFTFSWTGEQSITDIGRYKAVVSLAYGFGNTRFTTSSTYFWVIPIKALLITVGSFLLLFFAVSWSIKLYVRHMLRMAGVPIKDAETVKAQRSTKDVHLHSYKTVTAPVRSGYLDLRTRIQNATAMRDMLRIIVSFAFAYKLFFAGIAIIVVCIFAVYYFFADVTSNNKSYDVTISNSDSQLELSSEEIAYEAFAKKENLPALGSASDQLFDLLIQNSSAVVGTGAKTAIELERNNFEVTAISTAEGRVDKKTVIVFDREVQDDAVALSKLLGGALLSSRTASSTTQIPNITIFVGIDRSK